MDSSKLQINELVSILNQHFAWNKAQMKSSMVYHGAVRFSSQGKVIFTTYFAPEFEV